jgi:hypothetical protein
VIFQVSAGSEIRPSIRSSNAAAEVVEEAEEEVLEEEAGEAGEALGGEAELEEEAEEPEEEGVQELHVQGREKDNNKEAPQQKKQEGNTINCTVFSPRASERTQLHKKRVYFFND